MVLHKEHKEIHIIKYFKVAFVNDWQICSNGYFLLLISGAHKQQGAVNVYSLLLSLSLLHQMMVRSNSGLYRCEK